MNTVQRWVGLVAVGCLVTGVASADRSTRRPSDEERGKQLYERHCGQCHGPAGKGDGPATTALVAKVPDLTGTLEESQLDAAVDVVENGRNAMPGFEQSFDKYDARRVIRYARKLTAPAEKPAPAPVKDTGPADAAGGQ